MRYNDFGPQSAGSLSEITPFWGGNRCFDPEPLPPSWSFPETLWPLLNEANKQLMLLEGIGRSLPNPGLLLRPLQKREAILSSRMEGTFATARELLLYELDPQKADSETDKSNQHREVANCAMALNAATHSTLSLGLPLIRQLHQLLMDGVRGNNKEPGKYRTQQVAIGSNARFVPPSPDRLQDFLEDFDTYLHLDRWKYDPLVECFITHYQFETIHPFADGNGRVGRLLLTLMIQRLCDMKHPWLNMSEYFEQDHGVYCDHLYRISSQGAWEEWVSYCLQGVAQQAAKTSDRCYRLLQLRDDYKERLALTKGSVRLYQIVEKLFDSPIGIISHLASQLSVSYPTAKSDVMKLITVGILKELPNQHPKTYIAPEIFMIAYKGLD